MPTLKKKATGLVLASSVDRMCVKKKFSRWENEKWENANGLYIDFKRKIKDFETHSNTHTNTHTQYCYQWNDAELLKFLLISLTIS